MPLPAGYVGMRGFQTNKGGAGLVRACAIYSKSWVDAPAIVTNGYVTAVIGSVPAATTTLTLGGSLCSGGVGIPSISRNVVITITHATSIVAENGVVTGLDINGNAVTEAWSITATGTSKTWTGAKAFSRITSITRINAADASTNTLVAGSGKVLGLHLPVISIKIVAEEEDGTAPTAGAIVKASTSATADRLGTYTPNSTLDGAKDFSVWFLVQDEQ
jgi:hypothetical protein